MSSHGVRTDEQLASVDVAAAITDALRSADPARNLVAVCAVPAAILADQAGVLPRSLSYLAEIVRRGGTGYAVQLPAPLPTTQQSALVRPWLALAAAADADEPFARWLDAVAAILDARAGASAVQVK
jgi:hypothetical protein